MSKFTTLICHFARETRGNFAVFTAIALLPVTIAIGVAVDYSRVQQLQSKIQASADAALISAASLVMKENLTNANPDDDSIDAILSHLNNNFDRFFKANLGNSFAQQPPQYEIQYDPETKNVGVSVSFSYSNVFGNILKPTSSIAVKTGVNIETEGGGALSMFLVLDRSGSMNGHERMSTLKVAVHNMKNQFENVDPEHKFTRVGAIAYNHTAYQPTELMWGSETANNYVQQMNAGGGTNSSTAMSVAYTKVASPDEDDHHQDKNGQTPKRYILLLTDGANNRQQYDTATLAVCNLAKGNDIEIFTVAFQAPPQGQNLLRACASSPQHYFLAQNSNDLIDAFRAIGAAASGAITMTQ